MVLEHMLLYGHPYYQRGEKVDWDFRISDLVKNHDGTDV